MFGLRTDPETSNSNKVKKFKSTSSPIAYELIKVKFEPLLSQCYNKIERVLQFTSENSNLHQ